MFSLIRRKLAFRQAAYALITIAALAILISAVQAIFLYRSQRIEHTANISRQLNILGNSAARAAFHVDDSQATAILDGVMRIDSVKLVRISTNLGQILAERKRSFGHSVLDPLYRWLFDDISTLKRPLLVSKRDMVGAPEVFSTKDSTIEVGLILLQSSPEYLGQKLFIEMNHLVVALLAELLLIGVALVIIFHRSLTLPLLRYSNSLSSLNYNDGDILKANIPKGHEKDELGQIVLHTNELIERLKEEQNAVLHREKVASLGSMLVSVSHELNNPLAIIMSQTELLAETAPDDSVRERAAKILAPTQRCARIVSSFLALAQHRQIRKENISVNEIVFDTLSILDDQLEFQKITVTTELYPEIPNILADPTLLTQAFLNIIINSQQAIMSEGGKRTIEINTLFKPDRNIVEVVFEDSGPGISENIIPQVWEPFFSTKTSSGGTGLGLSYVYNVTGMHQGTVKIEEASIGGAKICLSFPVAPTD